MPPPCNFAQPQSLDDGGGGDERVCRWRRQDHAAGGVVAGVSVGVLAVHDPQLGIARRRRARFFGSPQAFKRVNYALAFLLLVSAWLTVLV